MRYRVSVDDNFHYMDERERSEAGTYPTKWAAVREAKRIVRNSLRWEYQQCKQETPGELYDRYTDFGRDPFVSPGVKFSAWKYAESQCTAICKAKGRAPRRDYSEAIPWTSKIAKLHEFLGMGLFEMIVTVFGWIAIIFCLIFERVR